MVNAVRKTLFYFYAFIADFYSELGVVPRLDIAFLEIIALSVSVWEENVWAVIFARAVSRRSIYSYWNFTLRIWIAWHCSPNHEL